MEVKNIIYYNYPEIGNAYLKYELPTFKTAFILKNVSALY